MNRRLEGVKPGSTIISNMRYGSGEEIYVVDRVTQTQAICGKTRFMIDSGVMVGTSSALPTRWGNLVKNEDVAKVHARARLRERIFIARQEMARISLNSHNIDAAEAFIKASQPKEQAQQNKEKQA